MFQPQPFFTSTIRRFASGTNGSHHFPICSYLPWARRLSGQFGEMVSPVRNVSMRRGWLMKKFIPAIPMMLVIAWSVNAQSEGVYRGRTSQGFNIEFTVVQVGSQLCVNPLGFAV